MLRVILFSFLISLQLSVADTGEVNGEAILTPQVVAEIKAQLKTLEAQPEKAIEAKGFILEQIESLNEDIRFYAACTLRRIDGQSKEAFNILVQNLHKSRIRTLRALECIGYDSFGISKIEGLLLQRLPGEAIDVVVSIVRLLCKWGTEEGVDLIRSFERVLSQGSSLERYQMELVLSQCEDSKIQEKLKQGRDSQVSRYKKLLSATSLDTKYFALKRLGYLGRDASSVLEDVLPLLEHSEPWIQSAACWCLGRISEDPLSESTIGTLIDLLDSDDRMTALNAATVLEGVEASVAQDALTRFKRESYRGN